MLVHVQKFLYLVVEMVYVVHKHVLKPFSVCLEDEIVVHRPYKVQDGEILPPHLQVIVNEAVQHDYDPSGVNLNLFSIIYCIGLYDVVPKYPYFYYVSVIIAYPLPRGNLVLYEFSIVGVKLKILVMRYVKAALMYEKPNQVNQVIYIKGAVIVYFVMVNNYFYMSH